MGRPERQSRTTTDREIDHRPRIRWRFMHGAFGSSRYSARCDSCHGCFLWGGRNAKAERQPIGRSTIVPAFGGGSCTERLGRRGTRRGVIRAMAASYGAAGTPKPNDNCSGDRPSSPHSVAVHARSVWVVAVLGAV